MKWLVTRPVIIPSDSFSWCKERMRKQDCVTIGLIHEAVNKKHFGKTEHCVCNKIVRRLADQVNRTEAISDGVFCEEFHQQRHII